MQQVLDVKVEHRLGRIGNLLLNDLVEKTPVNFPTGSEVSAMQRASHKIRGQNLKLFNVSVVTETFDEERKNKLRDATGFETVVNEIGIVVGKNPTPKKIPDINLKKDVKSLSEEDIFKFIDLFIDLGFSFAIVPKNKEMNPTQMDRYLSSARKYIDAQAKSEIRLMGVGVTPRDIATLGRLAREGTIDGIGIKIPPKSPIELYYNAMLELKRTATYIHIFSLPRVLPTEYDHGSLGPTACIPCASSFSHAQNEPNPKFLKKVFALEGDEKAQWNKDNVRTLDPATFKQPLLKDYDVEHPITGEYTIADIISEREPGLTYYNAMTHNTTTIRKEADILNSLGTALEWRDYILNKEIPRKFFSGRFSFLS